MNATKHDWANSNTLRAYPLEYSIPPTAQSGFELPHSLLADCLVIIQSDGVVPLLSGVHFSAATVTVSFVDQSTGSEIFMAQSPLDEDYTTSKIIDVSPYGITGKVVFGEVKPLQEMAHTGQHTFQYGRPPLSPRCYMCAGDPPVKTLSANIKKLYGDIKFRTSGSLVSTVSGSAPSTTDGVAEYTVELKLSDPKAFLDTCTPAQSVCDCVYPPIGKINSVLPDTNGNIGISISPDVAHLISIDVSGDTLSISLVGTSESTCPKENLPFPDGRLPSEEGEAV